MICICCRRKVSSINGYELCDGCTSYQSKVIEAVSIYVAHEGEHLLSRKIKDGCWSAAADWMNDEEDLIKEPVNIPVQNPREDEYQIAMGPRDVKVSQLNHREAKDALMNAIDAIAKIDQHVKEAYESIGQWQRIGKVGE